jgi:hypothetical protein
MTAPGIATPPVNIFDIELLTENWLSIYLGKKVKKPDIIVISKQKANVTIIKTRLNIKFLIAFGKPLLN